MPLMLSKIIKLHKLLHPNHAGPCVHCAIMYGPHNGAHLERPGGCSIFLEINVKDSQTTGPSKCTAFNGAQHIFTYSAQQNYFEK